MLDPNIFRGVLILACFLAIGVISLRAQRRIERERLEHEHRRFLDEDRRRRES